VARGLTDHPSFAAMRIDHIALWATDLERCKRFCADCFGATAGAGAGYTKHAKGFASYPLLGGPRRTAARRTEAVE
jgi:lactoylglutathione lyase